MYQFGLIFKLLKSLTKMGLPLRYVTLCYGNCYGPRGGVTSRNTPFRGVTLLRLGCRYASGGSR